MLDRAIDVAEFFIAHHCRDTSDTAHLARRLLGSLCGLEAADGVITKRTLGRGASRNLRTLEQYAAPMAVLVDNGWVELVPDTLSFASTTEDAVAAAKGFRLHPDARQRATRATNLNGEWSPENGSHGESNFVARVARVAEGSFSPPSPPSFSEAQGTPADTRDTRDKSTKPPVDNSGPHTDPLPVDNSGPPVIELDPDEDIFANVPPAPATHPASSTATPNVPTDQD